MFIASKSDTEEQLANAEYVYNVINKYIYELVNGRAGKENSE
jgi:hypothetical protein